MVRTSRIFQSTGDSLTIVRFLVGWDEEEAIVQLYQKLYVNLERIPTGASRPLLKPRRIDDVPVLALTFHGGGYDGYALRRIAASVDDVVKQASDVSETALIGGQRRQLRVELDATRLTAYQIDPSHVLRTLQAANRQSRAGSFPASNRETLVETGGFLRDAVDVGSVVGGTWANWCTCATWRSSWTAPKSRRAMCCSAAAGRRRAWQPWRRMR